MPHTTAEAAIGKSLRFISMKKAAITILAPDRQSSNNSSSGKDLSAGRQPIVVSASRMRRADCRDQASHEDANSRYLYQAMCFYASGSL